MKHARNVKVGVRSWLIANVIVNKPLKIKGFRFKIYMEKGSHNYINKKIMMLSHFGQVKVLKEEVFKSFFILLLRCKSIKTSLHNSQNVLSLTYKNIIIIFEINSHGLK
jgi:hypothetical protein